MALACLTATSSCAIEPNETATDNAALTITDGTYTLAPRGAAGARLDVSGQEAKDAANVQVWVGNGQLNQNWIFRNVSGNVFSLSPAHDPGRCLDVEGVRTASGTNVYSWTCNGGTNQQWAVTATSTGYTLTPQHANTLRLHATGAADGDNVDVVTADGSAAQTWTIVAVGSETVGGGTLASPAQGPGPSFIGSVGGNYTLVKNWNFGTNGTIKSYAEMNQEFKYHNHWNGIGNDIGYGSVIVAPDAAHTVWQGQPIEGTNTGGAPVRRFLADSLKTFLVPIDGATTVDPSYANNKFTCGNGSFQAIWKLQTAGSRLGKDLLWETRVRMVTPKYFWFAIWTAGTLWHHGAEMDVVESFGYDNGGGDTNFDGRYWHSNSVGGTDTLLPNFINNWGDGMASVGVSSFDATQWHTWQWLYRKDDTYDVYMDGIRVQSGHMHWTDGATPDGTPIDLELIFDGAWGNNRVGSVSYPMPASELAGTYYEWDYSRVYLR